MMTMGQTEALITYVRTHPCLYYRRDIDYSNLEKKDILWREIARILNLTSDDVKAKWKNLKDCYTKYKKELKFAKGQRRKFQHWSWAPVLSFLDCAPRKMIGSKSETTNGQSNDGLMDQTLSLGFQTEAPDPRSPLLPISAETPTLLNPELPSTYNPETPHPTLFVGTGTTETASTSSIKPPEDDIDKILQYLKNKNQPDEADLLFNSYAQCFKRLQQRTRAELKVKLAHIFAEAELKELNTKYKIP